MLLSMLKEFSIMSLVILEWTGDSAKVLWITNWIVTFTLLAIFDAHCK